jgi:hypothetical protein
MFRKFFAPAILATLTLSFAASAEAQLTDTETFRVTVNSLMSVQAPAALVSQVHDETDNDQSFPVQQWLVTANNAIGATVVFQTDQAFTHTLDNSYKRDAGITLALASGAAWTVTVPSATTDYVGGTEVVSVAAGSNTAGSAAFDIGVTLVEETFSDLASGDYEMTITGTLTAN